MGVDICVHILKRNSNINKWEEIAIYRKEKNSFNQIPPFDFRDYELFDILLRGEGEEHYQAYDIDKNILPEYLKDEIDNADYCYGFKEINFAELKLYLEKYPKIIDWNNDITKVWKDNPVKFFVEKIEQYIIFSDENYDFTPLSDYKILYWFG